MEKVLPLDDVRVLDLTQVGAGPYITLFLADAGADVVKVEAPGVGEMYRHEGPAFFDDAGRRWGGYFLRLNRNKRSVTVDLKSEAGRALLKDLVKVADILVENFRPDTMDRLGLGYQTLREINPRLIYGALSGFGHRDIFESPFADRPAFAIIAEAMGGVMDLIGEEDGPPQWVGGALGDFYTSLTTLSGILMALHARHKTGQGQLVDVAMYDAMVSLAERAVFVYTYTETVLRRGRERYLCPFGPYQVSDGYVAVAVIGDKPWQGLCAAMDRPDLAAHPDLCTGEQRSASYRELLGPILNAWFAKQTMSEAVDRLVAYGVPAAPIQDARGIVSCPHIRARDMLVEFEHPHAGRVTVVGNPIKMSGSPRIPVRRPPLLGEHTDAVLGEWLGLGDDAIAQLRRAGAL